MKLLLVCLVAVISLTCFLCNVEAGRKNENHKNGFKRHPKGPKNKGSSSSESDSSDSSESSGNENGDGDFNFSGDDDEDETTTEFGFTTTEIDVSGTSIAPDDDSETTGTAEDTSGWFATWGSSAVPEFTASEEVERETTDEMEDVSASSPTSHQTYPEDEFTESGESENDASKATEDNFTPLTTEFNPEEEEN